MIPRWLPAGTVTGMVYGARRVRGQDELGEAGPGLVGATPGVAVGRVAALPARPGALPDSAARSSDSIVVTVSVPRTSPSGAATVTVVVIPGPLGTAAAPPRGRGRR